MYNKQAFHKHCNPQHFASHRIFSESFKRGGWKENIMSNLAIPPANVKEMDDKYELHLIAPGYNKKDFLIALIDKKLSISVKKEQFDSEDNWKRQEYIAKGFTRQFELNEKVDKAGVKAKYEKGILILSLPKMEGFETSREEIKVE